MMDVRTPQTDLSKVSKVFVGLRLRDVRGRQGQVCMECI